MQKRNRHSIQGGGTMDLDTKKLPHLSISNSESIAESSRQVSKSFSVDSGDRQIAKESSTTRSSRCRSIRRLSSKPSSRPEHVYGHDTESYEKIRKRVLQERAVTNAIDALQERWSMIIFMYKDCVLSNRQRKNRKLKKLCVKRQFELITIACVFILICSLISVIIVLTNR